MVKDKVLELLEKNKDRFISGEEMAKTLSLSRNSIWKAVNSLKENGFIIDSQKKMGYRLLSESPALSLSEIEDNINDRDFFGDILIFKELESTNLTLKDMAREDIKDLTVVIADTQTAGRGRLGRNFHSPKMSGIYLSIYLKNPSKNYDVSLLTVTAAVALYLTLKDKVQGKLGIKWVNDLYLNRKKIAGILTEGEIELESHDFKHAIIGTGLNVLNSDFPEDLQDIASSLLLEEGKKFNRNTLIADLLSNTKIALSMLKEDKNKVIDIYNESLLFMGENVTVRSMGRQFNAKVMRINEAGNLIVKENNQEITVSTGEIVLKNRR